MSLAEDERDFLAQVFPNFKQPEGIGKRRGGQQYHRRILHSDTSFPKTEALESLTPQDIALLTENHERYGAHTLQQRIVRESQSPVQPRAAQKSRRRPKPR